MKHIPVLLHETIAALAIKKGGVYVDGTLGRAGHSFEILMNAGNGSTLIGIDRDTTALGESMEKLSRVRGVSLHLVHGNHGDLADIARGEGFTEVDGVLLDLGVSSPQLDDPSRGFSFRAEGPLDMRMNPERGETAADVVNGRSAEELARIFREYGEEPQARRIAQAVVKARGEKEFSTTSQFADFIERLVGRRGAHHPATRVFQALRMEVNDEIGELERALEGGLAILKPGGRFAVITFESLTDRIVKRFFSAHAGRMVSLQQGGAAWEGELPRVTLPNKHAIVAGKEELEMNVRSRSAKLRVAQKEAV